MTWEKQRNYMEECFVPLWLSSYTESPGKSKAQMFQFSNQGRLVLDEGIQPRPIKSRNGVLCTNNSEWYPSRLCCSITQEASVEREGMFY